MHLDNYSFQKENETEMETHLSNFEITVSKSMKLKYVNNLNIFYKIPYLPK
jgi:hypothetical protein